MSEPFKQHLIDPEICIRCYTCEMTCPINAIEHNDTNVVVNAAICNKCMNCIPVCPTGSIDEWRIVEEPYSLEDQYSWLELPEQKELGQNQSQSVMEAMESSMVSLLEEAHQGAGGRTIPPASASKPTINLYNTNNPVEAEVQGNYRLTANDSDIDIRHIILDFKGSPMPVIEGQTIGVLAPDTDEDNNRIVPRLYSVSSPRDGERPGFNNVSLTVKREEKGICSNFLCDLKKGDKVNVTGPFGSTFLLPEDPETRLLMICTGTGSAPMRSFTMRRQRTFGGKSGRMLMFFGARAPDCLPYLGPLKKLPENLMVKHLVYSRINGQGKEYVQNRMLKEAKQVSEILSDENTHIFICGLKNMEAGVEEAFTQIAEESGQSWNDLKNSMRNQGRYHVETY